MSSNIYDIAREAGVSIATVSRVFNDSPRVSPGTRDKILSIAASYGYYPKAQAQSLARRKTGVVAAIVPVISNYFFMEVLAGMQDRLSDTNFDLHIYNIKTTGEAREEEDVRQQVEDILKRGMADGYIIISMHFDDSLWAYFKSNYNVPITLIDEHYSSLDSVSVDSTGGAYEATHHLIQQGYERIAMLCAVLDSKPVKDRSDGFKQALKEAGLPHGDDLLYPGLAPERDGHTELNGYQAMKAILHAEKPFEAVFCNSDIQAIGALKAMRDYDKRLPIISFDDLSISQYLGLSTMRQPMYDMGIISVEKLTNRIAYPDSETTHTVYSPELIVRDSSRVSVEQRNFGL